MTLEQLNIALHKLAEQPQREHVLEFSFALMQWMGIEPNAGKTPQLIAPKTQKLKEYLVTAPQTVQPQLYRLSADNQNIRVRFSVLKKLKKEYITQLVDNDPGAESFQNTPDALKQITKAPYFIHFVTTTDYDRLVLVFNQGDQKKVVTLKNRLSNTQYLKVIQKWQTLAIKTKPDIAGLFWKSLDLNEVNKEFYIKIKERFDGLLGIMLQKMPHIAEKELKMFAIRLIGRYIFCWFLKEKEIIHSDLISSDALAKYNERYNRILKPLFFETLNTFPYPERKYSKELPAELQKYLIEIPYLNGGLFEPSVEDDLIPEISIDDWLLSFVRLLEQYSFTVDESSPAYEQVAIDPEMLGKILENLLASLNPETEKLANERNALGAFYTPRPIVDYMVTESLKVYFESHLSEDEKKVEPADNLFTTNNGKQTLFSALEPKQLAFDINKLQQPSEIKEKLRTKIDKLFDYTIDQNPFNATETRKLKTLLNTVKIIDPACGSGAFPMGVLHKLEILHEKLGTDKSSYDLRRTVLSQNIFGVDILPMAVEISRLRAWLALVLVSEYKRTDKKHNFNIKALPNLDFKFVSANTLVSVPENEYVDLMAAADLKLFEELTEKYFNSNTEEKEHLKYEIQECIDNITRNHEIAIERWIHEIKKQQNSASENKLKQMREKLNNYEKQKRQWHSYKNIFAHGSVDFFDTKYFFPTVKNGFDIVIGNPPYIQLQDKTKLPETIVRTYEEQKFKTFVRTGDIYCLFYEKGINLLSKGGILSYITSNKWMRAEYGKSLRRFFIENIHPEIIIDFGQTMVFESAIVHSNILLLRNLKYHGLTKAVQFQDQLYKQGEDLNKFIHANSVILKNLNETLWAIEAEEKFGLKEKVMKYGKPLSEWKLDFFRGIVTGCNKAFIIDTKTKNEFIKADRKNASLIKPVARGREIRRYHTSNSNSWLLFIPWHFPLHQNDAITGSSEEAEQCLMKDYQFLYNHLRNFKKELLERNKAETGIRYEWYALQRCANTYYQFFEEEKIIFSEIVSEPQFHYDINGTYTLDTAFFITGQKLKYLIALLNSKPVTYIFRKFYAGGELVGKYRYKKAFLERLPIPVPSKANESKFNSIVESIIQKKSSMSTADTTKEEKQIDLMVYHLYNFSLSEARIIDKNLSEEDFDKYKIEMAKSS